MLQGRLVDVATCLLSQRLPLIKDNVSQFAIKHHEDKVNF